MKSARHFALVFVTTPNRKVARDLVRQALEARLVACGNLLPQVESHYRWQGKLEQSREVLILFKTTVRAVPRLEQLILENHPYDTPEIISVRLDAGTPRYLAWIQESMD